MASQPVLLLSHGPGPAFFLEGGRWEGVDASSAIVAGKLPRTPSALLVVSAHYESANEVEFVGDGGGHPGLLYDYTNFPPATYKLQWPAVGAPPELAAQVRDALRANGVPVSMGNNNARGFDHGVFVPLKLIFPEGLPTLQISILGSLEPAVHQRIGAALRDLRAQNVLIVASGSITHGRGDPPLHTNDHVFFEWFQSTLTTLRGAERVAAIRDAEKLAPKFRASHPREEHYVPFIVGVAAAADDAKVRLLGGGWWHSLATFIFALE